MSSDPCGFLVRLLLTLILVTATAQGLVNSPKIIAKDGNLIFESGLNRNISFRLNGNARLNINDEYDLLDLVFRATRRDRTRGPFDPAAEWTGDEAAKLRQIAADVLSLRTRVFGPAGLDLRFRLLQNRTRTASQLLRRYKSRVQRAETRLQSLYDRLELDNCKSNPCENGGTCLNMFAGFLCKCPKNFEGTRCESDVNECALFAGTDLGCQNGAQCVNQFGSYSCLCQAGWFGIHCTQRKGDCMQASTWELCGHGTCVSSNDSFGYKCICDQGWKTNGLTPACNVDVDECSEAHTTCVTKCINLPGSFTCAPCAAGLTGNGINCRDIDECATLNGGCSLSPRVPCINSYGSYHCGECPIGWTGDGRSCVRSGTPTDAGGTIGGIIGGGGGGGGGDGGGGGGTIASCSSSNICHPQATCLEISNTVVCNCPIGMVGSGVGVNGCVRGTARNCAQQPCLNGGTCVDDGDSYICLCPAGFAQPNCTAMPDVCTPNPCRNNGRCRAQANRQVVCQCAPGFSGERCEKRFNRCGGILTGQTGRLTYPQGSLYEHNAQCAWVIRTVETRVLNVTFNRFQLEDSTECRFDWLQINDGRTAASQIIGRFCGSHKPLGGNIISTTNNLYLWFRSDNSTSREGFDLEWTSIPPQCGGIVEVETHGTISSPGSPGNYPQNRDCRWLLRAPNHKRLKLTFFSLQIERHDNCNFDFVEISDEIAGVVTNKFCTTSHPEPLLLPTNEAAIHFHSDNEGSDSGFQIYYSTEERIPGCGGTYTTKEGHIYSPSFAGAQESISCEYDIRLAASESITIEFQKFQMGADDCLELYDVNKEQDIHTLQSKYCGGYEMPPVVFHSLFNAVQVKFYGKPGAEFQLRYRADCSYTFESPSGVVRSPGYPQLSKEDRYCTYKIITEPGTVISVHVVDFDLKDSSLEDNDCAYTSLRINDDLDKKILGPFCGEEAPPADMVSKTNMLMLQFQSGLTTTGRGFKIEYKAVPMGRTDCGGVYTKPGYSVRLPTDDEGLYMHDMTCYWVIMAPKNKHILLTWKSFKLEESTDCSYDYVEIYDNLANSETSRPMGRYCDANPPTTLLSHSPILTIKFVSDSSDAMDGFEFSYEFVESANQCGGNIYSSTGKINSPNWPLNYANNQDCVWVLNSPPETQMQLQVEVFQLEYASNCSSDWLEVRNGGFNQSTLIGRFCGNASSIPRTIPSFTNQLYLHFHSDSFVSHRGFQIRWQVFANGCGGNLVGESGTITSPYYPDPYPNNAECEWRIHVPSGSFIHLTIVDLDIERLSDCRYDVLELFEGTANSKIHLTSLCTLPEGSKPLEYVTSTNDALIVFRTDESSVQRGFLITYRSNCTVTLTRSYGVIESPNFGERLNDNTANDVNCTWTLKAPKGNHIQLELTFYDSLYEELFVGIKDGNRSLEVREAHHVLNSASDTLVITQTSSLLSFQLEYSMVGCIGTLHRDSGDLTSPNYPRPYPNDIECRWEIRTEPGRGIELTVSELDIEESVNCTKDALVVSSHPDSNNPKERHCGHHDHLVVTSSSHRMFVRFYSDSAGNAKGFDAHYSTMKSQCGGQFISKNGVIQSPNYPNNYPENADCEWTIVVSDHHAVIVTLEELDLEDFYNCEMDYLEVYEEAPATTDADVVVDEEEDGGQRYLFKKCGTLDNATNTWRSTGNRLTVHFHSDDSVSAKGFKLSFQEDCGERMVVDEYDTHNLVISKHEPNSNQTCEWQLIARDPAKHVLLMMTHVQLNPSWEKLYPNEEDCSHVGVVVFDGADDRAPVRSRFCKTHPPDIVSNGHALTIRLPLGVISEFEASASLMDNFCGGFFQSLRGKFATPYYPASYPVNVDCVWYLEASSGNRMALTIESMDLEDSDSCNNDYLEVRETDERGRLLGLFCGANPPGPLDPAQSLWIKFASNNDVVGKGFLASYNYVSHNELNSSSGTIESPAYPTKFHSHEPYSWRITVDKDYVVLLTIKHIVDMDMPFIKFYDGYSTIGAEIDYSASHVVRSNTNILFLTAARGPFRFEWEQLAKEVVRANRTAEKIAQICGDQVVRVNGILVFNSPGYPDGYESNLHCNWTIMAANPTAHVELSFGRIDLEEFDDCFADYVVVSASSDLQNWKQLDKLCQKTPSTSTQYRGTPHLRLEFVTDAGGNKTGFESILGTACGAELTGRRGLVNITDMINVKNLFQMECAWPIRVRQGRRVRIRFTESLLHGTADSEASCRTYFLVRNGLAEDSPFLGKGKYCDNNITDVLETTSNRAYVKFTRYGFPIFRAAFHYEEIAHECSDEVALADETPLDRVKSIATPNYPNIPNPHSECVWKVTAPLHHVIAVDFVGKFDLAPGSSAGGDNCDREFVQLNDGATEMMPLLGRYCGTTKPNTVRSSGNVLRITYFSDVSEPHLGFMANVSIGRCGGAYYDSAGVIQSPSGLKLRDGERELECVYTIEMERGSTISIWFEKLNLPESEGGGCGDGSHIELQEIDMFSDEAENVTDTLVICGTAANRYIVETNKLVVRYRLKGQPAAGEEFRLSYSAIGARCGETIVASRGILQTPGYPGGLRKPTQCSWRLLVPKGRRIKIEVLDFDSGAPPSSSPSLLTFGNNMTSFIWPRAFRIRLALANDFQMTSIIGRYSDNPPPVLYSTDNTMGIDALILAFGKTRGFKLRFTSDEDSVHCRNQLDLNSDSGSGTLRFRRDNNASIYCSYDLNVKPNRTFALHVLRHERYERMSSWSQYLCGLMSPLQVLLHDHRLLPQLLCQNETQPSLRLPVPARLVLSGSTRNMLRELQLQYQTYKCGGLWSFSQADAFTITQPSLEGHRGRLECAWAVWNEEVTGDLVQVEVNVSVSLRGKCEDEYLLLYNGPDQNSPHLGRYCGQATAGDIVEHGLFFEYVASAYDPNSRFNVTIREGSGCGGRLKYPYRTIYFSDQYKNDAECVWELATEPGFHLAVVFLHRFFIEDSPGCRKDFLKVQQRNASGDWVDLETLCGRSPPAAVNTTSTGMRLIFRSDGDTVGDGFTASFERNCGGIVYADREPQTLFSPGYPDHYFPDLVCNYTILPRDPNDTSGLLVRFLDFEVEDAPIVRCMFDNVTLYTRDAYDHVEETVLCGRRRNYELRSQKPISVVLRTDATFASKGFLLEYGYNVCGGLVTNSTVIQSPHQHSDQTYPHSSKCFWNITAPAGYKILLKFEWLDFESQDGCIYDGVGVYRGLLPVAEQRLAKFCGNLTGHLPVLTIPTNTGLIYSYADDRDASRGFRALVRLMPNCDRTIFLGPSNYTYSLNSYAGGYANNLDCSWTFTTTAGRQLQVDFGSFHVEEATDCAKDFLEIRDGGGPFADLIGQFCGHSQPPRLMSSRSALLLRFVSDGQDTSAGFTATISSTPLLCGQHSLNIGSNETTTLRSPDDGAGKYPNNVNCIWQLRSDKTMHLKFERLDIDGPDANGSCSSDYLKFYNTEDAEMIERGYGSKLVFNGQKLAPETYAADFAVEHIYCGHVLPDDYFTSSKALFVKFKSDGKIAKGGFQLTVTPANGCFRNFTGTQGRIRLAEAADHCDIYIRAPPNYTLSLYYSDMLFYDYECEVEYIEVFDAHTNASLQKVCHFAEMGKALFSHTNELRLRLRMSNYYTQFDMTYLASPVRNGPGCGGDFYNTAGIFTNPFYPDNVRNNSDCRWNVRVPSNLRVFLKFQVFDMGAKATCHSDYLQIIERNVDGTEQVMRQFCGEDEPNFYKSERNLVIIRFHKTVNYDGTGWVIAFSAVHSDYVPFF